MIKACLFDLDGVITDTAYFHYLAWRKTAQILGGDIDEEFNETLKGVDRKESLNRILSHINVEVDENEFEIIMNQKNELYLDYLNELSKDDILPGIEEFMKVLNELGIKIIVASASKNAPFIIEKLGLNKYIDDIANPEEVTNNKPAPDIFLLAAKLADSSNVECIGIEDSQAGIDALNLANIKSIAIGKSLDNATYYLDDTSLLNSPDILRLFKNNEDRI